MHWIRSALITGKAWTILLAVAGAITALIYARQSGKAAVRAKVEKKARQTERKATKALTQGLAHEQEALDAARARRAKRLRERSK